VDYIRITAPLHMKWTHPLGLPHMKGRWSACSNWMCPRGAVNHPIKGLTQEISTP